MPRSIARPALVGPVAALALLVPLAGCGSSSSTSTAASTAQSTTTSTPMASASDSSSMDMSPSASSTAGDATSSASDAASDSASAASPSASSTATATSTATNTAMSGKKMMFAAKKDAKVPATLTPYAALTMKKVVFPKTLGGAAMLGSVSEGAANRYVGYSDPSSSDTVTATASTNSDAGDVDTQATGLKSPSSYDGGRIVCGVDPHSDSQVCIVHIAGPEQITVSTTARTSNDKLAKLTAEFLNAQK